ncbi:putative transposase Ptta/En/Spm plant [Arabidopsis suecica]|uniref:Putative transposase Ptta/En/Spm plant n=1 Tax=Arabidopsis suecica TaxID=45249 RepID=A0A8T2B8T6_ARASU|nr:putative transposase Ptta/En/Spm plant [Arabidopsis suecica]
MAPAKGKVSRGHGGKSTSRGPRVFHGQNPLLPASPVRASSHSSNPNSATQSVTQSQSRRPSQYPPSSQNPSPSLQTTPAGSQQPPAARRKQKPQGRHQHPSSSRQQQPPPQQQPPQQQPPQQQPPPPQRQPPPQQQPPRQNPPEQQNLPMELNDNSEDEYEEDVDEDNPQEQNEDPNVDYQELLDRLLALLGREHLPLLSPNRIPGVETLWFNRHKGKLSRVIAGIFRRKFDGPYFSWKVTPIPIRERYFRSFARKYNWDVGITELVREGFLVIAKKRLKGIVSQAKQSGVQPPWIRDTLWAEMWVYWNTEDAIERSENASQCRNSDRGGLGVHKHLAGQKSFVQVHQEMEEKLKRPVSLGEVFMQTHTRADGSFVDQKAKEVAEAYAKDIEDRLSELDEEGPQNSANSSEHSTDRMLNIDEKNEIFLKERGRRVMRALLHQPLWSFKNSCGARYLNTTLKMQDVMRSTDEVIDLSYEPNQDKPKIPEVKDGPMTRSKARRLKEGFNKAVETLLTTMELGEMSRNIQESTTLQESSTAPDLDLTEDFARLSLKEAPPTETHCKFISLAGAGAKNIKISTKNTSELQVTSKTSNGSNKLQVGQEHKLEGNHVETLEDLHLLELKGLQEEESIKEIKLDRPDPDKTTSASSKLISSQNQRSFHHLCGAIDPLHIHLLISQERASEPACLIPHRLQASSL